MHEEILCPVVGDHDDRSSEVCLYCVELQITQQVVGNREQGSPDEDEVKGRIFGLFVSRESDDDFQGQDSAIGSEDDLTRKFVPESDDVDYQKNDNDNVSTCSELLVSLFELFDLFSHTKGEDVDTMANHEEKGADQKGSNVVAHQANVSNQRENESEFDEAGHQMLPGFVLIMNVVDHQHDGYWFQELQVVDLEPLANHLENGNHEDSQIQNRQRFQLASFVQSLRQLLLIDHNIISFVMIGRMLSKRMTQGVLQGLNHLRERVDDLVL